MIRKHPSLTRDPSASSSRSLKRCRGKSEEVAHSPAASSLSSFSPRTDHESIDTASCSAASPLPATATRTLPLEFWEREEDCKEMKAQHTRFIDRVMPSRERLIMLTTLWKTDIAMEANMFPYKCPDGIEHWTLWSVKDLCHGEVCEFVEDWLAANFPQVRRWNYDDNLGQRSIELFHVHVYIETKPFSFIPDPEKIYRPIYRFDLIDDDLSDVTSRGGDASQMDRKASKRARSERAESVRGRRQS